VLRFEDRTHGALPDLPDQDELSADLHPRAERGSARARLRIDRTRLHLLPLPSAPPGEHAPGEGAAPGETGAFYLTTPSTRSLGVTGPTLAFSTMYDNRRLLRRATRGGGLGGRSERS